MGKLAYLAFLASIVVGIGWGVPALYKAGYRYSVTGDQCHYASLRKGLTERPNDGACPLIARRG